ncbi:MAG: signal peptidase II [Myxococcota bacterium]|nr:signal peptidase II [Myxococcota bacterium]
MLLTSTLFGCDHATKIAAKAALAGGRVVPICDGILELRYAANDDTAFSLLHALGVARNPGVLLLLPVVAIAGLIATWIVAGRRGASPTQHAGLALVLAGALGNVVDRAVRGYVIDFIHIARWPVFNVADVAVCAGVGVLVFARHRRAPPS